MNCGCLDYDKKGKHPLFPLEDGYPFFSKDVAEKIGKAKNTNIIAAAAKELGLMNNPEFHTSYKISPANTVSRYNVAAVEIIQTKLKREPEWNQMNKKP
jgi:hypothetical protein